MRYSTSRSGSHTWGTGSPRSTDAPQSGQGMNRDRNTTTSWAGGLPARWSPNSPWPGSVPGPSGGGRAGARAEAHMADNATLIRSLYDAWNAHDFEAGAHAM